MKRLYEFVFTLSLGVFVIFGLWLLGALGDLAQGPDDEG